MFFKITSTLSLIICTTAIAFGLPTSEIQIYRISIFGFEYSKLPRTGLLK